MVKTLDTPTYLNMLRTALTNANAQPSSFSTGIALTDFDQNAYTNWQEKLIGGTADFTNFSGSLKGGNENTNFLLSSAYHKESTVLPGDFGYNKFSTNFNINHSTLNKKLKIGASVIFSADDNKLLITILPIMLLTRRQTTLFIMQTDHTTGHQLILVM